MRSFSLGAAQSDGYKSNESTMIDQYSKTLEMKSKIKSKIKTFTQFDYKTALLKKNNKNQFSTNLVRQNTNVISFQQALFSFALGESPQKSKNKLKNTLVIEQLDGVKTERRQRFKRIQNPMSIINFYKKHQGFQPTEEQLILLDRVIKLKEYLDEHKPINLELVLKKIYKILNIAVDLNQTKFFLLVILMAGEICFEAKQFNSAFYFFNQTLIAATCMRNWTVKLQALIYIGRICTDVLQFMKSVTFFKKALQYAWKVKDSDTELRIYDLIGTCFNSQGRAKQALYYHNRYILGQSAKSFSAVRRTAYELLKQYQKTLDNSQKQNLTILFIRYLRLPINNFSVYPPFSTNKIYPNYINDQSPRKLCQPFHLKFNEFPDLNQQIDQLLKSEEFKTQIPNPDLYTNFVVTNKYGKVKKQIEFEKSNQYHKIIKEEHKQIFRGNFKPPVDEQLAKMLQQKPNPHWWEDILLKSKRQRTQKVGSIRNRVRKTHLSFHKFPQQKKKYQQLKTERIVQTINKIILNYIDPQKL